MVLPLGANVVVQVLEKSQSPFEGSTALAGRDVVTKVSILDSGKLETAALKQA